MASPFAHIADTVRHRWRWLLAIGFGITIAGLNMIAFMWTKPLLNFVPFWADPLLARADRLLFLGTDPWKLLDWLNSVPAALFYHRGWFAMMIVTLLVVLSQPASVRKSAVMLSYFILWSIVGPIVHILMPAAGPVFYAKLGYGSDFAGIRVPEEMTTMSDYLWNVYQGDQFGPGSGISAMPSMHIATTAWMVIAIYVLARRLDRADGGPRVPHLPALDLARLALCRRWDRRRSAGGGLLRAVPAALRRPPEAAVVAARRLRARRGRPGARLKAPRIQARYRMVCLVQR